MVAMEDTKLSPPPPEIMMPQPLPSPLHRRLARSTVVPALALAALWTASARLAAQSSYSQNFNSQTPGNTATGFTEVRPTTATTGLTGSGAVIVNQVPEASTGWALLPTGLALLAWRRLRSR